MSTCNDQRRPPRGQRGDILLEALIGVLLTAIVAAGMAGIAAKLAISQRDAKLENVAVEQLRTQLQDQGLQLCELGGQTRFDLPGKQVVASVTCPDPVQVTVSAPGAGVSHPVQAPREIRLQVAASDLDLEGAKQASSPAMVLGTQQAAGANP